MINNPNTYNPQNSAPMPPMPPGPMMPPLPMREALLKFPSWLNKYAVVVYVMAALAALDRYFVGYMYFDYLSLWFALRLLIGAGIFINRYG